jgi:hypothetical protein
MNKKIKELAERAEVWTIEDGQDKCEVDVEKFAELIIREHLIVWEMMDNGNKVAGYVEMEDYPKAIINHFGINNEN